MRPCFGTDFSSKFWAAAKRALTRATPEVSMSGSLTTAPPLRPVIVLEARAARMTVLMRIWSTTTASASAISVLWVPRVSTSLSASSRSSTRVAAISLLSTWMTRSEYAICESRPLPASKMLVPGTCVFAWARPETLKALDLPLEIDWLRTSGAMMFMALNWAMISPEESLRKRARVLPARLS